MIGYIVWGICTFLLSFGILLSDKAAMRILELNILLNMAKWVLTAEFWILGVDFGDVSISELMEETGLLCLLVLFIFPPIAALLPSFIIGFIANFALEEKFELKCSDDFTNEGTNLCSADGTGCCQVISSHDISNTYTFVGGLASNILATWAVIRICGYLLVSASDTASVFAKRKKM